MDKLLLASAFGLTLLAVIIGAVAGLGDAKFGLGHVSRFAAFWLWLCRVIERIYYRGASVDLEFDFIALFPVFGAVFLIRRQWKYALIVIVVPLLASIALAAKLFN